MRRILIALILLAAAGLAVFYVLTMPQRIEAEALPKHVADIGNGERMFHAGGCASCHGEPEDGRCENPRSKDKQVLAGGRCLVTPFGKFLVPNISPDKAAGIGAWSDADFVTAMVKGVSPGGSHYYPAFPFTSYQRMRYEDLLDLKAYMMTLPASAKASAPHELALPFRLRRGLGLWKLLYLDGRPFTPDAGKSQALNRGAYLVEGPGHCGECHTPRGPFGGSDHSKHLAGGPAPEGDGWIPNITPSKDGIGAWTEKDIAYALSSGFKPDFDSFGGAMVAVQQNMGKLPPEDVAAIAAYLRSLKPVEHPRPRKS
jgi:mono/diheme cytochrome c family protein